MLQALVGGLPPLVGSIIAAIRESDDGLRVVLIASSIWLSGATALRLLHSRHKDARTRDRESPTDLSGCLHVLYSIIKQRAKLSDSPADKKKLRLTIYRVDGEHLEQCVPYVGGDGGSAGRRISIRSGVAGQVALTGKTLGAQRVNRNHADFINELVERFHFPLHEAELVMADRFSWLGVPVMGKSGVIAVIFMDSSQTAFFAQEFVEAAVGACAGVASFVETRYPSS